MHNQTLNPEQAAVCLPAPRRRLQPQHFYVLRLPVEDFLRVRNPARGNPSGGNPSGGSLPVVPFRWFPSGGNPAGGPLPVVPFRWFPSAGNPSGGSLPVVPFRWFPSGGSLPGGRARVRKGSPSGQGPPRKPARSERVLG